MEKRLNDIKLWRYLKAGSEEKDIYPLPDPTLTCSLPLLERLATITKKLHLEVQYNIGAFAKKVEHILYSRLKPTLKDLPDTYYKIDGRKTSARVR